MKRFSMFAGLAALVMFAAGCNDDPTITSISPAPPGATAEYFESRQNDARTIRLTEGVAIAFECKDYKNKPCGFDGTTIEDGNVAAVRRAWSDYDPEVVYGRGPQVGQRSQQNRTVFVVMGKRPGRTKMILVTGYGEVDVNIEVLPAKGS
jgi:hypothetical protein